MASVYLSFHEVEIKSPFSSGLPILGAATFSQVMDVSAATVWSNYPMGDDQRRGKYMIARLYADADCYVATGPVAYPQQLGNMTSDSSSGMFLAAGETMYLLLRDGDFVAARSAAL